MESSSSRPTPEQFGERSVFHGLARRVVTQADLLAHSVAVVSPSVSALGIGFSLPYVVGPGAWLSLVLGFGTAFLLAVVFGEFGSRLTAAGSLYTYVAKGLGPAAALVVGVSLIFGYAALIGFGLVSAGRRTTASWEAFTGAEPQVHLELVVVGLGVVTCLLVMRRGVRYSTRLALVAESLALAALLLVLVVTVRRSGLPGMSFFSLEGAEPHAILTGAAMISLVTVGFESSAALGVEAGRPFLAVPRAMRLTVLITGFLVCLASVVSAAAPPAQGSRWRWWSPGSVVSPLDGLTLAVLAGAFLALSLCAWTALSRLLFSFAREGILPAWFGRVGRRFGNPDRAAVALVAFALLPPAVSLATGHRPAWAASELLSAATVILFVAYALTSLALILFLRRLDELSVLPVVLAVVAAAGVGTIAAVDIRHDVRAGWPVTLVLLGAVVAVGLLWRMVLHEPHRGESLRRRVGNHDATLVSEVVLEEIGRFRHE